MPSSVREEPSETSNAVKLPKEQGATTESQQQMRDTVMKALSEAVGQPKSQTLADLFELLETELTQPRKSLTSTRNITMFMMGKVADFMISKALGNADARSLMRTLWILLDIAQGLSVEEGLLEDANSDAARDLADEHGAKLDALHGNDGFQAQDLTNARINAYRAQLKFICKLESALAAADAQCAQQSQYICELKDILAETTKARDMLQAQFNASKEQCLGKCQELDQANQTQALTAESLAKAQRTLAELTKLQEELGKEWNQQIEVLRCIYKTQFDRISPVGQMNPFPELFEPNSTMPATPTVGQRQATFQFATRTVACLTDYNTPKVVETTTSDSKK